MILRSLPYPGYTWSLTQHAAGFNEGTIRGMLVCAVPFEGRENFGSDITALMVEANLLTPNQRDGKDDAWRDYQQVLPELGLIVSTKIQRVLTLTNVAHALVAEEIEFTQLVNMQVLRYQYPNGHKNDISPALRAALIANSISPSESLIELQSTNGVLVKPALLILQVLIGLMESGAEPSISADECRAFVVPCKTNLEADDAVRDIIYARQNGSNLSQVNADKRLRRNLQDWFKLLRMTTIFESDGNRQVTLSSFAKSNIHNLSQLCSVESEPSSFWIPTSFDSKNRLSWFAFYGVFSPSLEKLFAPDVEPVETMSFYTASEVEEYDERERKVGPIQLTNFTLDGLFTRSDVSVGTDIVKLAESVRTGAIKRHAKALLHDQIVQKYAERYQQQGAQVLVDPNSIDLFVRWGEKGSAIFEVKTVTPKSMPQRIRLAVGQIKEYAFRIKRDLDIEPDQALIIDRPIDAASWQREFISDYMNIGVICSSDIAEVIFEPKASRTSTKWGNQISN